MSSLKKISKQSLILGILSVLSNLAFVSLALFTKYLMDAALAKNLEQIISSALWLVGTLLLGLLIKISEGYLRANFQIKREMELKRKLYIAKLQADFYLTTAHTATTLQSYNEDVSNITSGELNIIPNLFAQIARLIYAAILLAIFDWRLLVIFLGVGICGLLGTIIYIKLIRPRQRAVLNTNATLSEFAKETWENLALVRAYQAEENFKEFYQSKEAKAIRARKHKNRLELSASYSLQIVSNLIYALLLVYGAFAIYHDVLTYGTILAILQLLSHIQGPIFSFSPLVSRLTLMQSSKARYLEQLKTKKIVEASKVPFKEITFNKVSFKYDKDFVIKDLSFNIKPQDIIQIAGESGKGKSTLFALLLGLIKPSSGHILINDGTIDYTSVASSLFAYVPQENILFSGTIRENFELLCGHLSDDTIWQALSFANLKLEITSLDQVLNERGKGLSIGQLQRLLIALAYAKDRPIFLLDEFSSALDLNNAQIITEKLKKLNKTIIFISHKKEALEPNKIITL